MEDYRAWALAQGAERIARAAGEPGLRPLPVPGGLVRQSGSFWPGIPAGCGPGGGGGGPGRGTDLAGSWFDRAEALGGYVNLRLAPAWYGAVASAAVVPGPVAETAVPPCPAFPAALARGTGSFSAGVPSGLYRLPWPPGRTGRTPPGWSGIPPGAWRRWPGAAAGSRLLSGPPGDRELLRLTAEYPARRREPGPALGRYLAALARQLWRLEPVSGAVQRACAGVLGGRDTGQLSG